MNKILFIISFLSTLLSRELISHDIIDSSPYGLPIQIKAFLDIDSDDYYNFILLYRPAGNLEYIEVSMNNIGKSIFQAEIPSEFCMREYVEYYLLLEMKNHSRSKFPTLDANNNPIRVYIESFNEDIDINNNQLLNNDVEFDIVGLKPNYVILSPKPGERMRKHNLFIALSYFGMENIDPLKIKIYLDEINVTSQAYIDSSYLMLPSENIVPGFHTVKVNLTNNLGQKFNDIIWNFTVLPGDKQSNNTVNNQSSKLKIDYNFGKLNSEAMNIGEMDYKHRINFDWLDIDLRYFKSSLENEYSQTYNRYFINLKNEYLNINFGDSYPFINNLACNGARIRGVDILFSRKPIYFKLINGVTLNAIQGDPNNNAMVISAIDSTKEDWEIIISRNNYQFQQNVSAMKFGLNFDNSKLNFYYLKVKDNIPTVSSEVPNAKIVLSNELIDMFDDSDSDGYILFDSLKNNLPENLILTLSEKNWIGLKPQDNYLLGTEIEFGLDESRILFSSGLSVSFLNQNTWNKIGSISEFDTLNYDFESDLDGNFVANISLDTTFVVDNYKNYFSFGQNAKPLLPHIMQQGELKISELLNLSNLSRYYKIRLRYLGHNFEIGNKQNGPDYYSLLSPFIRTNYKENYFSDRFNMFANKLLFYYKKSVETENIYSEVLLPIKINKSIFNISLYPGYGLPTFNIGFQQWNRTNSVQSYKTVIDTLLDINENIDTTIAQIIDNRLNLSSKQFNISMTNKFKFWIQQTISLNILLFEQTDEIFNSFNSDTLLAINYLPKNAISESYAFTLKSVYNKYWESRLFFNTCYYDYGKDGFDYNMDGIYDDDSNQKVKNYQFRLIYNNEKIIDRIIIGTDYSTGIGNNYFTQYNTNIKLFSQPLEDLYLEMLFNYRTKYLGKEFRSPNDFFIRLKIIYDIL